MHRLLAIAEQYPQIRLTENFQTVMQALVEVEKARFYLATPGTPSDPDQPAIQGMGIAVEGRLKIERKRAGELVARVTEAEDPTAARIQALEDELRRARAGGPARTIPFTADVAFTRAAFTPKRARAAALSLVRFQAVTTSPRAAAASSALISPRVCMAWIISSWRCTAACGASIGFSAGESAAAASRAMRPMIVLPCFTQASGSKQSLRK